MVVNRTLKELEKEGLLILGKKKVIVKNYSSFKKMGGL